MFASLGHSDTELNGRLNRIFEEYFKNSIPKNQYKGWIVQLKNGKKVGCGGLVIDNHPPGPTNLSGKIAYIMNMYVDENYRGMGMGKKIFSEILIFIKKQGIKLVSLHTSEMGKKLYESFGFKSTNEMRLYLE